MATVLLLVTLVKDEEKLPRWLSTALCRSNIRVFFAEHAVAPGQNLTPQIRQGIAACDLFILLWSKHSSATDWVRDEIGQARAFQKTILPVLLDKEFALPSFLTDIKHIDASEDAATMAFKC